MFKQEVKGVNFIICDTNIKSLELSPVPNKFHFGACLTKSIKTEAILINKKIPTLENIDEITQMLGFKTKLLFIITGLGGETRTAAIPIIAKASGEMDVLRVALVSTSFLSEGVQRNLLAREGLAALKKQVDTFTVISHNTLCQLSGERTIGLEFEAANQIFAHAVKNICGIVISNGYSNVGIKDARTAMKMKGISIMCSASAKGEDRAVNAIKVALPNILSKENNIRDAGNILLNISSELGKEPYESNPNDVNLLEGLGISYYKN